MQGIFVYVRWLFKYINGIFGLGKHVVQVAGYIICPEVGNIVNTELVLRSYKLGEISIGNYSTHT